MTLIRLSKLQQQQQNVLLDIKYVSRNNHYSHMNAQTTAQLTDVTSYKHTHTQIIKCANLVEIKLPISLFLYLSHTQKKCQLL